MDILSRPLSPPMPRKSKPPTPTPAPSQKEKTKPDIKPLAKDPPGGYRQQSLDSIGNYMREMEALQPGRLILYSYRDWPVIDKVQGAINRNKELKEKLRVAMLKGNKSLIQSLTPKVPSFLAKYTSITSDQFLAEWGSGDYHFILTDGATGNTVCQLDKFSIRNSHPPVIDPDELVISDPLNKNYVDKLRSEGNLPPDPEDVKTLMEQEAMAQQQSAVENLTGLVGTLTEKLITVKDTPPPPPAPPSISEQAFTSALRIQEDAAKKALENASKKEQGGMEGLREVVGLVKELMPPPPKQDNSAITAMVEAIRSSNAQTQSLLTGLLERKGEEKGVKDRLQEFVDLRELLIESGLAGEKHQPKESILGMVLPTVTRFIESLPAMIAAFKGEAIPVATGAATVTQTTNPTTPSTLQLPPGNGNPNPGPNPATNPNSPLTPAQQLKRDLAQIPPEQQAVLFPAIDAWIMVGDKLLKSGEEGGNQFAFILDTASEESYTVLASEPDEQLQLLVGQQLSPGSDPEIVGKFVTGFKAYGDGGGEGEDEEGGKDDGNEETKNEARNESNVTPITS